MTGTVNRTLVGYFDEFLHDTAFDFVGRSVYRKEKKPSPVSYELARLGRVAKPYGVLVIDQ